MYAGLLICDHVALEYQKEFGDYPDMFGALFPDYTWRHYDCVNGELPKNTDECHVYFATGSKHSVYEDMEWIHNLQNFIVELYHNEKIFIGFCFGHQLIGQSLGGKVGKSSNGWCVGVHEYELIGHEEWMQPPESKLGVLMMCQDQIFELPENSKVLAKSELCPHAIIQVGKSFLGIQGHPEFTKAYDKLLMGSRGDAIGKDAVDKGIDSLNKSIHHDVIGSWIIRFIESFHQLQIQNGHPS